MQRTSYEPHIDYRKWLATQVEKRRIKNPSFSMRALAKHIGTSPATLSQVMSGRRPLSRKLMLQIANGLGLSEMERFDFINSLTNSSEFGRQKSYRQVIEEYPDLDLDKFALIAEWYHLAILYFLEVLNEKKDPATIARRFCLSPIEVRGALKRLETAGLVKRSGKGYLRMQNNFYVGSSKEEENLAIQHFHSGILHLARKALVNVPAAQRDMSTIVMAADPKKIALARKMVQRFRRRLCKVLESGDKEEVFALSVQLFPITQPRRRK